MSPNDETGSPSPLIAGADDPIHGRRFKHTRDDAFGPDILYDLEQNSPDTLQSLDTSRKGTEEHFAASPFQFTSSPHDGSFHEYSSDSAESERKADHTTPDAIMDGVFDPGAHEAELNSFDQLISDSHVEFTSDDNGSRPFDMEFNFNEADFTIDQPMDFPVFRGSTGSPSNIFNPESPASDSLFLHHRQNSVRIYQPKCSASAFVNMLTPDIAWLYRVIHELPDSIGNCFSRIQSDA